MPSDPCGLRWESSNRAQLKGATYTTKLPGAPAGEYVVVLYDTALENRSGMIENVVVMKEKGGQWKVSGHFTKPAGKGR